MTFRQWPLIAKLHGEEVSRPPYSRTLTYSFFNKKYEMKENTDSKTPYNVATYFNNTAYLNILKTPPIAIKANPHAAMRIIKPNSFKVSLKILSELASSNFCLSGSSISFDLMVCIDPMLNADTFLLTEEKGN